MPDAFLAQPDADVEKLAALAPAALARDAYWPRAAGLLAAEAEAERKAAPGTPDAAQFAAQSCEAWARWAAELTEARPVSSEQPPPAMALVQGDAGPAEFVDSSCSLPPRHLEAAQMDAAVALAAWEH